MRYTVTLHGLFFEFVLSTWFITFTLQIIIFFHFFLPFHPLHIRSAQGSRTVPHPFGQHLPTTECRWQLATGQRPHYQCLQVLAYLQSPYSLMLTSKDNSYRSNILWWVMPSVCLSLHKQNIVCLQRIICQFMQMQQILGHFSVQWIIIILVLIFPVNEGRGMKEE